MPEEQNVRFALPRGQFRLQETLFDTVTVALNDEKLNTLKGTKQLLGTRRLGKIAVAADTEHGQARKFLCQPVGIRDEVSQMDDRIRPFTPDGVTHVFHLPV